MKYGVQLLISLCCLFFYAKAAIDLRRGVQNSRKRSLMIAFACLWSFWVVMNMPFAVFELKRFGTGILLTLKYSTSALSNAAYDKAIGREAEITELGVFMEQLLFGLKQSFAIVNSLLLIILIRPFQEPLKAGYRKLACKKK